MKPHPVRGELLHADVRTKGETDILLSQFCERALKKPRVEVMLVCDLERSLNSSKISYFRRLHDSQ
jgi:hypothetical protein